MASGEKKRHARPRYILASAAVIALLLVFFYAKFNVAPQFESEREAFAMGTLVRVSAYGPDRFVLDAAVADVFEEISRLEGILSLNIPTSEISAVNAAPALEGGHSVSAETYDLLLLSLKEAGETGGAFDPTVGAPVRLWGIGTENARIPGDAEINEALKDVGWQKIKLWESSDADDPAQKIYKVSAAEGQALDLGAIAKGYAADRASQIIRGYGIKSAIIDLGGNLAVIGESPNRRGWRLGFQDPYDSRGNYFAIIETADSTLVTSGPYERFFERDGALYHHILDPTTGRPAKSDLSSVSVVMDQDGDGNSARADALSTALFVMGREKAMDFLKKHGEVQAILVFEQDDAPVVYMTEGLKNVVTLKEGALRPGGKQR